MFDADSGFGGYNFCQCNCASRVDCLVRINPRYLTHATWPHAIFAHSSFSVFAFRCTRALLEHVRDEYPHRAIVALGVNDLKHPPAVHAGATRVRPVSENSAAVGNKW